mgnify:CR=1 FL=1
MDADRSAEMNIFWCLLVVRIFAEGTLVVVQIQNNGLVESLATGAKVEVGRGIWLGPSRKERSAPNRSHRRMGLALGMTRKSEGRLR